VSDAPQRLNFYVALPPEDVIAIVNANIDPPGFAPGLNPLAFLGIGKYKQFLGTTILLCFTIKRLKRYAQAESPTLLGEVHEHEKGSHVVVWIKPNRHIAVFKKIIMGFLGFCGLLMAGAFLNDSSGNQFPNGVAFAFGSLALGFIFFMLILAAIKSQADDDADVLLEFAKKMFGALPTTENVNDTK